MQTNALSQLSRRTLLSGAAASLALPLLPRRSRALSPPTVSEAAWRELGKKIKGGVLRPNDPRFVALTQPENLRYYNPPAQPGAPPDPDAPFGVVRPHTAQEVAFAIKWARDTNLPMVPRSGGHSYAGCSTVPGLVINSSAMQSVTLEGDLIQAGGGALFGNMLAGLRDMKDGRETGRYTITHGRCGGVGLSAYLMGGGLALDSPHAGMGCDRVQKVEIVLADGRVVTTSENDPEHRDLFWAARGGGGGNLGFVTKWWLKPLSVDKVVAFSGTWRLSGNAQFVFRRLLHAIDAAPDRMGAEITVSTTSATVKSPWRYDIKFVCQLHGSRDEFDAILGPTLAAADLAESKDCSFNDCSSQDCLELPYWDAQEFFEIKALPNRYQETSLFAREVSDGFIDEIFRIWPTWPGSVAAARLSAYRLGGKVNTVAPDAMAFVHRSSRWLISTDIDWSGGDSQQHIDENLKWQRNVHDTFSTMLGRPGSYQNFPDPGLDNHARAYWGNNFWRLLQIKGRYDPDFVFTPPRNQGIFP
jgi:FAD/FMN-containing dehydrogenase